MQEFTLWLFLQAKYQQVCASDTVVATAHEDRELHNRIQMLASVYDRSHQLGMVDLYWLLSAVDCGCSNPNCYGYPSKEDLTEGLLGVLDEMKKNIAEGMR